MSNNKSNLHQILKQPSERYTSYLINMLTKKNKLSKPDRLELVIVCAISFGGLCFEEPLRAFYEILKERSKKPINLNNDVCYEFEYRKNGHPCNVAYIDENGDKQTFSFRRWSPDLITKSALIGYYRTRNTNQDALPSFDELMLQIACRIFGSKASAPALNKILPQLLNAGMLLTNCKLHDWLFSYCTGETFAASADPRSLKHFCQPLGHQKIQTPKAVPCSSSKVSNNNWILTKQTGLIGTTQASDFKLLKNLISICESEIAHRDRQRTIKLYNGAIKRHGTISLPCEILINWVLNKLNDGKKWQHGGTTPFRYLKALHEIWLNYWLERNISDAEQYDADETYQYLLLAADAIDKSATSALVGLYKFIVEYYPEEIQIPENHEEEDKVTFVRSKLVSNELYEKVRDEMQLHYQDKSIYFKRAIDLILILVYRCGIRIKECFHIRMKDIALLTDYILVIRKREESGKTFSSNRQLNLSLLLTKEELKIFKLFIEMRKYQTLGKRDALLFTQDVNTNTKFDYSTVNDVVINLMQRFTDEYFVFYEFRHTAITNWILICFADIQTAVTWTGYSEEQVNKIKANYSINNSLILDQIKGFAGHLSPSITLSSYAHLVEFCLANSLLNIKFKFTLKNLADILNCSQKALRKTLNKLSHPGDLIEISECARYINTEFSKNVEKTDLQYSSTISSFSIGKSLNKLNHSSFTEPTLESCIKLAKDCSQGAELVDVSKGLMLHPSFCDILLKAVATTISKYEQTRVIRNQSGRLKTTYSPLVSENSPKYTCPEVNDSVEFTDMLAIAHKLIKINEKITMPEALTRPILESARGHSFIIFSDVEKLFEVIDYYKPIVGTQRLYVTIEPLLNESVNTNINKRLTNNLGTLNVHESSSRVHERSKFPDGRYKLHVKHLQSEQLLKKRDLKKAATKYSTNTLKVSLFWVEVFSSAFNEWSMHDDRVRQLTLF